MRSATRERPIGAHREPSSRFPLPLASHSIVTERRPGPCARHQWRAHRPARPLPDRRLGAGALATERAMEFNERITALAAKVGNRREMIQTEEAAKNAFVMPFISTVLGYDVFDPLEVVPEFTADVGVKKGEKVDYAV